MLCRMSLNFAASSRMTLCLRRILMVLEIPQPWNIVLIKSLFVIQKSCHIRIVISQRITNKWLWVLLLNECQLSAKWEIASLICHHLLLSWWRHQVETFSALLALCGEFTGHRWIPLTKASDAELWCFFFGLCLNKQLSKQSRGCWFETPSRPSGRHCNDILRTSHDSESTRITISKLLKPGLFMDIRGQPFAWGSWVNIAGWFLAIEADYIWVFDIYHSKLWSDCHWLI